MFDSDKDKIPSLPKKNWFFDKIKSTNVKIGIVIAFFVGYQELMPILKDVLGFTEDDRALVEECKQYTDDQIQNKKDVAEMWLEILTDDVYKLNKKAYEDSIVNANKLVTVAIGLRADANGIVYYRSKHGNECPVRYRDGIIQFRSKKRDTWLPIFIEDLD